MSASAPVPSKAAIHALRGLLFGTSCSLVLLAEERRQRIKLARSAVENGRKLKSVKRYSTNGANALEALQEEVVADPNFVGWPNRNRNRSSSCEPRQFAGESSYLDQLAHDLGPDARRPTRQTRDAKQRETSKHLADDETRPYPQRQAAPDAVLRTGYDSWSRFSQSKHTPTSSSLQVGQVKVRNFRKLGRDGTNKDTLALILSAFCTDNPQFKAEDSLYTSGAALELVRRVYKSAASADELPKWVVQISSILCVACRRAGHLLVAEQIFDTILRHGPIRLSTYIQYEPYELIKAIVDGEEVQNLDEDSLRDRIKRATNVYMADIVEFAGTGAHHYIQIGKKLANRALQFKQAKELIDSKVFERFRYMSRHVVAGTAQEPIPAEWMITKLAKSNECVLAIDAFVALANTPDFPSDSLPICKRIVDCVVNSRGYKVLEVLEVIDGCRRRDGWIVPSSWIDKLLSNHWSCTRDYDGARKHFAHVVSNRFYDISDTYGVQRTMVRICLEANDMTSAKSYYASLCLLHKQASKDPSILLAFTRFSANQGDWAAVRAGFEAMANIPSLTTHERQMIDADFTNILEVYAKDHTWGEIETFIETYVHELMVNLDHRMVRFIADRHAKCRDIKAFARWMKFCKDGGFHLSTSFWSGFFIDCRRSFGYSRQQMNDMYKELATAGLLDEFPDIACSFKAITPTRSAKLSYLRMTSPRFNPADENTTWTRMKEEAFHGYWDHVLATYDRALHHNMGYSSRCLRLAVKASVKLNGPGCHKARALLRKARSQGHDVSEAIVPIILGTLDQIYESCRGVLRSNEPSALIKQVLSEWQDQGLHLHEDVLHRATRVCLKLRNYREALSFCVLLAQSKGNDDLCYSASNFQFLLHVWVSLHDYDRVRWLLDQLKNREYRLSRICRQSLNWAAHYLQTSSMSPKEDTLRQSDLEMLADVMDVRKVLRDENHAARTEAEERFAEALTGRQHYPRIASEDSPDADVGKDEDLPSTTPAAEGP
ncbi:hypothetical protein CPLU01_00139 [Colletotrichum plurivorum]|uniref:Uncharacterized protein n=1 Tax=Colletotrichum plurivorum TaxID=2175906 RepID=A0A8H6U6L6_9PEZI|nr:hypothetical protein CPLU01_00139 [Colletotrichum plurivorum]